LVARLQSITRSRPEEASGKIEAGGLIVDPVRRSVIRANRNIDLSRSEFSLLVSLIRSAGRCVPRQSLMEGVWGSGSNIGPGALDVLINSLRGKIDAPYQHKLIRTVRRSGYMLNDGEREMGQPRR
jgi:DNA-binding response OmpR family regulator